MQRHANIKAIVAQSGTSLWADCWVKSGLASENLDRGWLEFWGQTEIADLFSQFSPAVSPFLTNFEVNGPAKKLLLPNQPAFAASEFILPLPSESQAQYDQLWTNVFL